MLFFGLALNLQKGRKTAIIIKVIETEFRMQTIFPPIWFLVKPRRFRLFMVRSTCRTIVSITDTHKKNKKCEKFSSSTFEELWVIQIVKKRVNWHDDPGFLYAIKKYHRKFKYNKQQHNETKIYTMNMMKMMRSNGKDLQSWKSQILNENRKYEKRRKKHQNNSHSSKRKYLWNINDFVQCLQYSLLNNTKTVS